MTVRNSNPWPTPNSVALSAELSYPFHIRPCNDAFYPSKLNPWSKYVTGIEGKDPGFDVFDFFIQEAKKRNIKVHAWLNPYRVSKEKLNEKLVFANGGYRRKYNIREDKICAELNVEKVFGIGGDYKANSSSWILKKWGD